MSSSSSWDTLLRSAAIYDENGGVGILVRRDGDGERAAASHASLKLQDTDEVRRFLELVVEAAEPDQ